ncbi:MAG: hydrogenase maturation protease [Eggerthellaceae bacterium]|jgi:hydrogenase maturation protease
MTQPKIAVLCVGNLLMMDDGIGPIVCTELERTYSFPENVKLISCGSMTLDLLNMVGEYDLIISLDAADDPGAEPGTVFRYTPDDLAHRGTPMGSLHELRLADLFDAAFVLGMKAEGLCFGVQVENSEPSSLVAGLTPKVAAALPLLVDSLLAELVHRGCTITVKSTGEVVEPGYHHVISRDWNAPIDPLTLDEG